MAEITNKGFKGKTLVEYKASLKNGYLSIDSGWNLEPESIDAMQIAINSEMYANLDEQIGLAYSACDPDTAVGQSLVNIAYISGVPRKKPTYSKSDVLVNGVSGTIVPKGSEIRNKTTGTLWVTDDQVTISGQTKVSVTCKEAGAKTAGVGDLSIIATPVSGWQEVTNTEAATIGSDSETIDQLRARRNNSVGRPGSNQVDNMYGNIASVDGVTHLKIYENEDDLTDDNNVLPHSMAIFVQGGTDEDVAAAIAVKKNPGCGLNAKNSNIANKVTIDTKTPKGSPFKATFFRPEKTTINVVVTIKKTGEFDNDVKEKIRESIIEYANATIFSGESVSGFDKTGFDIGEDVPAGKLYTPVSKVVGSNGYVESITVNGSQNVTIPFNGLSVFSESSITVDIT